MFNRKKKKQDKQERLLEETLEISTDEVYPEHPTQEKEQPNSQLIQPAMEEDEIVVTASTIPDDFPEIGPSYQKPVADEPQEEEEEPVSTTIETQRFDEIEHDIMNDEIDDELPEDTENEDEKNLTQTTEIIEKDDSIIEESGEDLPKEIDMSDSMDIDLNEELEEPIKNVGSGYIWTSIDTGKSDIEPPITNEIPPLEPRMEQTVPTKDKVDLNTFFEASTQKRKLKRSERKKYSKKELKRRKKQTNKRIPEELKDQRVYRFRRKKYKEVEEFIAYLNDHYLDIDDVAKDVLADENFFGWVGKRSGVFPQSLDEFRIIKDNIERNQ